MKVIHLVTKDSGGAGRAAIRISDSLNKIGVESKVVVLDKTYNDDNVFEIYDSRIQKACFKIIRKIYRQFFSLKYNEDIFYESKLGCNIWCKEMIRESDVINLHWINYSFISLKQISKLKRMNKKIVWTMHDMWPFTGGCYYDEECGGYKENCKNCKIIQCSQSFIDKQVKQKRMTYKDCKMVLIGCSNWITNCANESSITDQVQYATIHNPIETQIFKPLNRMRIKNKYGVSLKKKIVLFGAIASNSDTRKGYKYLKEALGFLNSSKYEVVIFGNDENYTFDDISLSVKAFGKVIDDSLLTEIYNLGDVFVAPSIQENLANTVLESLSCGTPVVAFNIGGMSDMIENCKNGYLATPFSGEDLAKGIENCVLNKRYRDTARETVLKKFEPHIIAKQYMNIYEKL